MREIKFRAWNTVIKSMSPISAMGLSFKKGAVSTNDDSILMQFTGLKDKNGKEIYEGDIVGGGHVVEWLADSWKVKVNTPKGARWYSIFHHQDDLDHVERVVIGNIYENPELIT